MQRRKVLLPEPLEPSMAITSPSLAVSDTPFRTSSGLKLLCTSSQTSAGWAASVTAAASATGPIFPCNFY